MTNTTDGPQVTYEFANFRLLPREKRLVCGEKPVKLQPKVFDTLLMLVENQGRLVEKDNFLKGLWPNTFVEEGGGRWSRIHRDCREARIPISLASEDDCIDHARPAESRVGLGGASV